MNAIRAAMDTLAGVFRGGPRAAWWLKALDGVAYCWIGYVVSIAILRIATNTESCFTKELHAASIVFAFAFLTYQLFASRLPSEKVPERPDRLTFAELAEIRRNTPKRLLHPPANLGLGFFFYFILNALVNGDLYVTGLVGSGSIRYGLLTLSVASFAWLLGRISADEARRRRNAIAIWEAQQPKPYHSFKPSPFPTYAQADH